MILALWLLLAQPAAAEPPPPPALDGAEFHFARCVEQANGNFCIYRAGPVGEFGMVNLVVTPTYYMVSPRPTECRGDWSSNVLEGPNYFYDLGGRLYRSGTGAGWEMTIRDHRIICGDAAPEGGRELRSAVANGMVRLSRMGANSGN